MTQLNPSLLLQGTGRPENLVKPEADRDVGATPTRKKKLFGGMTLGTRLSTSLKSLEMSSGALSDDRSVVSAPTWKASEKNKVQRKPESHSASSSPQSPALVSGVVARLSGLRSQPQLNGLLVTIVQYLPERGRYLVQPMDTDALQLRVTDCLEVKPKNLAPLKHQPLREGARAVLHGTGQPGLDDRLAVVEQYWPEQERYGVQVLGLPALELVGAALAAITPQCLRQIPDSAFWISMSIDGQCARIPASCGITRDKRGQKILRVLVDPFPGLCATVAAAKIVLGEDMCDWDDDVVVRTTLQNNPLATVTLDVQDRRALRKLKDNEVFIVKERHRALVKSMVEYKLIKKSSKMVEVDGVGPVSVFKILFPFQLEDIASPTTSKEETERSRSQSLAVSPADGRKPVAGTMNKKTRRSSDHAPLSKSTSCIDEMESLTLNERGTTKNATLKDQQSLGYMVPFLATQEGSAETARSPRTKKSKQKPRKSLSQSLPMLSDLESNGDVAETASERRHRSAASARSSRSASSSRSVTSHSSKGSRASESRSSSSDLRSASSQSLIVAKQLREIWKRDSSSGKVRARDARVPRAMYDCTEQDPTLPTIDTDMSDSESVLSDLSFDRESRARRLHTILDSNGNFEESISLNPDTMELSMSWTSSSTSSFRHASAYNDSASIL